MASSGKSKYKHQQSASLMLNTLNYCLKYEIDNPKLKHVSFTYVNLSGDNSILNVYVDSFDRSKINELISELDMAKGVFRSTLAKKLNFYKVPQIVFLIDKTIDQNLKIEELLKEINNK